MLTITIKVEVTDEQLKEMGFDPIQFTEQELKTAEKMTIDALKQDDLWDELANALEMVRLLRA